jgi:hypothetical protein
MAAQYKFDASKPFFASVGAGEVAVEKLRKVATDLQGRLEEVRSRGVNDVAKEAQAKLETRLGELQQEFPKQVEARLADLQGDARSVLAKLEAKAAELGAGLNESLFDAFDEQAALYSELIARGEGRIAKLRDDSISGDAEIIDDAEPVKDVSADVEAAAARAAQAAQDVTPAFEDPTA